MSTSPNHHDGPDLPGPLSTVEFRDPRAHPTSNASPGSTMARPLALCAMSVAPLREIPEHVYDQIKQVAVAPDGQAMRPTMDKDWTTIEGTHTDGDGGDNELWDWEEIR